MVEKLQCPVCTLFLHAGMNLSDHLETHPKEQVIMALVQLTIPRTECNETADDEERTVADGKKRDVESSTLTASSKIEKQPEVGTRNDSSSPLNFPCGTQQPKKEPDAAAPPLPPSGKQVFNNQDVSSSPTYQKNIGAINLLAGVSGNVAIGQNEVSQMPTDFSTFPNRYQITQQHQQQPQQHVPGTTQRTSPNPPLELTHQIGQHSKSHHQQRQQLQLLTPLHAQHQSPHRLPHPLPLTQQQSKLNVIFSSALPPPSPQVQPLHQKPPPAYGTAISQMRSQHNQNKQTHHQQHMQRTAEVQTASSSKQFLERKSVTPLLQATSPQKQHHSQQKNETVHLQFTKNILSNVVSTSLQKSVAYQQSSVQPPSPPSTDDVATVALPIHSRLTHSPYPSILSAAVASSSPCSSVLRYAESPVTAHYLERDNGDFIVQETPKRIVECVEKDNGEFSVIERFYQSPPSVLRIHDDEEDNEVLDVSEQDKAIVNEKSIKAQTRKEDNTEEKDQDTEEEFMSIDGDSDVEESSSEKSLPEVRGRNIKESVDQDVCVEKPTTSAAAAAQVEQNENTALPIVGNNNTVASNGVTNIARKKSSKNTITVLSDVQLNLNEYLDLVGNIIASSKIGKSQAFAAATRVPLLKVEKVEPMDEYETEDQQQPQSPVGVDEKITNRHVSDAEIKEPALASCLREPPTKTTTNNKENITETDELVANIYSDKPTTPEKSSTHRAGVDSNLTTQPTSHATTSVIRMATTTTSQQHLQQQLAEQPQNTSEDCTDELEVGKTSDRLKHVVLNSSVAEDLSSQTLIKSEVVSTETTSVPSLQPPLKKGPKKLVIKPKLSTTEAKNRRDSQPLFEEQPTTYARAKKLEAEQDMLKHSLTPKNVVIKSEPNITIEATSILEQHLHLSAHPFELKQEKFLCRQDTSAEFKHESLKFNIKHEFDELNNTPKVSAEDRPTNSTPLHVDEETRVLMEFASSNKKEVIEISSSSANTTFLSANSIFGVASTEEILINSTSNSTSSLARATSVASCNALATLRCDDEFIVPDATDCVQEIIISSCYSSQSASDVALNNCSNVTDTPNSHQQQHNNFSDYPFSFLYGGGSVAQEVSAKSNFSPIYQQQQHDATTAATLASGSNSATIEEFPSDQAHRNQTTSRYHHHNSAPARQWYQSVSTSNTDFETALDVDCGGVEGGDAGNYLDLDSYKRVNMTGGVQTGVGPSSSLSSFTAATESSLAGCTTDALNIRTDEKMPAKGEISEQESNCDIENSWSQSMYGDIPVRFFKSSFPGLFPPENCWNNEEYFTVQDLSASTGATNVSNRATKSFDFRLPLETGGTSSSAATAGCSSVHQRIDSLPSTSSKRKRKRDSKNSVTRPIAATVTSHDLLLQDSQPQQSLPQQHDHQLHVYHEEPPTTSAAILAGPSTAAAASAVATSALQNRVGKVFSCVHCLAKFSRLKDRNLHMIAQHNYVLRNYRLVPMQKVVTATATMAKTTFVPATIADLDVISAGASCSSNKLSARHQNLEQQEDSKQGIVKIELDPAEQAISGRLSADVEGVGHILAKSELDESAGLALANNVVAAVSESADPVFLPSLTRLYNLYHMLVSFNIAALKQNQTLSEADEKLMLSSIFFCFICRQKFGTVKLYDAHMTEHPAECYTCGKKFHRWQNLSLHLKRHLGWKEFGCSICDKKFVVRSALVEHMRMHTGQKPLKCNICDKHFKRFSNLAQHRKRHGKQIIRKKEFVCHCGEVLPSKARFLWHKETHDAKPKCCPYCCDRFVHANSLRRHIRLAHSDKFDYTEPMECPMCKQVFAKSSIRAHMATHSMDMQHMCPICSKSFSTKWNLKIHSWVHANRTSKPFKCEHCPKAFVREVDFKNHMNAHKQIKPYTCEYCGCKFIRKYNYMRHRREHHGNKKFTCDLCKKSFHRHYYLIEHRRIHTGERPFQCTICGKSSTTKTNHNKHLKIHHSRDPFTVEA